jgi:hypothetical protein
MQLVSFDQLLQCSATLGWLPQLCENVCCSMWCGHGSCVLINSSHQQVTWYRNDDKGEVLALVHTLLLVRTTNLLCKCHCYTPHF